jgi:hypothetical protein
MSPSQSHCLMVQVTSNDSVPRLLAALVNSTSNNAGMNACYNAGLPCHEPAMYSWQNQIEVAGQQGHGLMHCSTSEQSSLAGKSTQCNKPAVQ